MHRNRKLYGLQFADMQETHKEATQFCANFLWCFSYNLGNQCVNRKTNSLTSLFNVYMYLNALVFTKRSHLTNFRGHDLRRFIVEIR